MKNHLNVILTCLLMAVSAVAPAIAATPVKKLSRIFPSLSETIGYWHEAVIMVDKVVQTEGRIISGLRVRCGKVMLYGGPPVLCVRLEKDGKTIQEAYFISTDPDLPVFQDEKDRAVVMMPSGFVLMDIKKEPNQTSEPTAPSGRGSS